MATRCSCRGDITRTFPSPGIASASCGPWPRTAKWKTGSSASSTCRAHSRRAARAWKRAGGRRSSIEEISRDEVQRVLDRKDLPSSAALAEPAERAGVPGSTTHYRWIICALLFFATVIAYLDRSILGYLEKY